MSSLRALARDRAADRRAAARAAAPRARRRRPRGRRVAAAEARRVAGALVDERDRLVDHLDRARGRPPRRVSPQTTRPCLASTTSLRSGFARAASPTCLDEREAGPDVRDPRGRVAEALAAPAARRRRVPASTLMPSGCVWWTCGAGTNACSSVSIEAARHRGVELAAREVGDHVLVAHLVALDQRQHLVEPQAGEVLARPSSRGREPEPLTHITGDLAAGVVDRRALGRRVAAAEVRDRAVGAEQVRGEHELAEHVVVGRRRRRARGPRRGRRVG